MDREEFLDAYYQVWTGAVAAYLNQLIRELLPVIGADGARRVVDAYDAVIMEERK